MKISSVFKVPVPVKKKISFPCLRYWRYNGTGMKKNDPFVTGEKTLVVLFSSEEWGTAVVRNFDVGVTLEKEYFVSVNDPSWGDYKEPVSVIIDPE